jgi:hypothetical protein
MATTLPARRAASRTERGAVYVVLGHAMAEVQRRTTFTPARIMCFKQSGIAGGRSKRGNNFGGVFRHDGSSVN